MLPSARQGQILQWLQEKGSLSIDDLAGQLDVSVMTVHRDLDTLARNGLAVKVHGGVTLPDRSGKPAHHATCHLCDLPVHVRSAFTVQVESGEVFRACCPHCGFFLMSQLEGRGVVSALTKDFLYGRTMDAMRAVYVLDSQVTLCCVPGVLCFASREDATRFQTGFGGNVMTPAGVREYLLSHHGDAG